ncbi:MAG: 4Fe-4S dicluster domain-containing protein [Amoebophilaceae bacterium]|nr:4Fe-4S dicluster domain-containing protein [Amoebophilaceae bacterium]
MALRITDACINCGACEPECPNNAIYEGGVDWRFSEGTTLKTTTPQPPYVEDIFYIVTDKCTECVGFHDEPQCAAVCPVDCCVLDLAHTETEEELWNKKRFLHES